MLRARLAVGAGLGPGHGAAAHDDDDERRPGRRDLRRQRGQPVARSGATASRPSTSPRARSTPRSSRCAGLAGRGHGARSPYTTCTRRQRRQQVPEQRAAARAVPDLRHQDRRDVADDRARQQRQPARRTSTATPLTANAAGLRPQRRRHRLGARPGDRAAARRARIVALVRAEQQYEDIPHATLLTGSFSSATTAPTATSSSSTTATRRSASRRGACPAATPDRRLRGAARTTTASTSPTASRRRSRPTATPRTRPRQRDLEPSRCSG